MVHNSVIIPVCGRLSKKGVLRGLQDEHCVIVHVLYYLNVILVVHEINCESPMKLVSWGKREGNESMIIRRDAGGLAATNKDVLVLESA